MGMGQRTRLPRVPVDANALKAITMNGSPQAPVPAGAKICDSCSEQKPLTAFLPSSLSADGFTSKCRLCILSAAADSRHAREARLSQ